MLRNAAPAHGQVLRGNIDGVTYVNTDRPLWNTATTWRIGATHSVQIGLAEGTGAYLFEHPSTVRLSNGRIVVGDMGSSEVRFYDPDGRHIKTVGRKGEGPGEFVQISHLRRMAGDSILVAEFNRSNVLTTDGKYVRRFAPPTVPGFPFVHANAYFPDGGTIVMNWPQGDRRRVGSWTDSAHLFLVGADGKQPRALGPFPAVIFASRNGEAMPLQFGPMFTLAAGRDVFAINFTNDYQINLYDRTGKLTRVIGRAWTPVAVSSDDIRRYGNNFVNEASEGGASTPEFRAFRQKRLEQTTFAKTHPAHGPMMFDSEGYLWVKDAKPVFNVVGNGFGAANADPTTYDIFDPSGAWLGSLQTPARFKINDIGRDYILGVYVGEDDVEFIRSYSLDRRR